MTLLALAALLQANPEVDEALKQFKLKMRSTSTIERAEAALDLGKVPHARTLAALVPLLTADFGAVRAAAARALTNFVDQKKAAVAALERALAPNEKEPQARSAILAALGKLGEPATLPSILRHLEDKDVSVAKASVHAATLIGGPHILQPLIDQLRKLEKLEKSISGGKVMAPNPNPNGATVMAGPDERAKQRVEELLPAVREALETASGGEVHASADAWQAWWNRVRATFQKP
jgi:hypothetical protein